MTILGYLPKLKGVLGLALMQIFCMIFSEKCSITLYQWKKFQCHNFFPSQDIKQNVLLSSY